DQKTRTGLTTAHRPEDTRTGLTTTTTTTTTDQKTRTGLDKGTRRNRDQKTRTGLDEEGPEDTHRADDGTR
ncbi:MAG: hypothetical protein ACYS22_02155, partial [Planctomycetota bacterium]